MATHQANIDNLRNATLGEQVRGSMIQLFEEDYNLVKRGISIGTDISSASDPTTGYYDGNVYINSNTLDIWKLNGSVWTRQGNLKGIATATEVTSPADDGLNTITFTLTDGTQLNFTVKNGSRGSVGDSVTGVVDNGDGTFYFTLSNGTNTGNVATIRGLQGIQGIQGATGATGRGVTSITSADSGKNHVLSANFTDGTSNIITTVKDGNDGVGTGDMQYGTYDPTQSGIVNSARAVSDGTTTLTLNDIQAKANKATDLSGYGITDAYTKTDVDNLIKNKIDEPTKEGSSGQALITDGNGGRRWGNIASGGSILHVHTRDFTGMTVTVKDSDPDTGEIETLTSTFDSTGLATFHVTGSGIAEVSVTDTDGKVYKSSVNMTYYGIYAVSVNRFSATINVTVESGANVTATDGTNTYSAVSNGVASISIGNAGSFTVSATIDGVTSDDKKTVAISSDGETKSTSIEFAKISVDFTGTLIASVTNGTFTKPINSSVAPVVIYVPSLDTYQISGTLDGNQIDTSVVVNAYTTKSVTISASSFYEDWLTLGGFSTATYPTLADLLTEDSQGENEKAIRKLMTLHDCADKLLDWYNDNPSDFPLNEFTSSRIAMKWIGLRDYVCDKLMAIEDIYNAMMNAKSITPTKPLVPIMTSGTSSYGTVISSPSFSGRNAYTAFNGNIETSGIWVSNSTNCPVWIGYSFTTPVCVKKIGVMFGMHSQTNNGTSYTLQATNVPTPSESDWVDISSEITSNTVNFEYSKIENNVAYKHYRIYITSQTISGSNYKGAVNELQFYGDEEIDLWEYFLKDKVPTMTSNNVPYGKCFADANENIAYNVFEDNSSSFWQSNNKNSRHYVGYEFTNPMCIQKIHIKATDRKQGQALVEGSNDTTNGSDGTWTPIYSIGDIDADADEYIPFPNDKYFKFYRISAIPYLVAGSNTYVFGLYELQFYGRALNVSSNDAGILPPQTEPKITIGSVTYWSNKNEREFEPTPTMRYIYDNGVELEQVTKTATSVLANIDINTTDKLLRATVGSHATTSDKIKCGSGSATLTSDMMPNNCYLDISSISGTQEIGFSQVVDTTDISCWVE